MGPNNCPGITVKSIQYDLNRLCIEKQDASIKITTFRAKWCLRINFKRYFSLFFYIKLRNPIVATSYLWGSWCKQTSIYSIWGCFQLLWLYCFWSDKFWKTPTHFYNSLFSHFERGLGPSFQRNWSFTQLSFEPSLVETGPAVLEKKSKK